MARAKDMFVLDDVYDRLAKLEVFVAKHEAEREKLKKVLTTWLERIKKREKSLATLIKNTQESLESVMEDFQGFEQDFDELRRVGLLNGVEELDMRRGTRFTPRENGIAHGRPKEEENGANYIHHIVIGDKHVDK